MFIEAWISIDQQMSMGKQVGMCNVLYRYKYRNSLVDKTNDDDIFLGNSSVHQNFFKEASTREELSSSIQGKN
jgi:hypothetical protein